MTLVSRQSLIYVKIARETMSLYGDTNIDWIIKKNPSPEQLINFILNWNYNLDTGRVNLKGKKYPNEQNVFNPPKFSLEGVTDKEIAALTRIAEFPKIKADNYTLKSNGIFFQVYDILACSISYPPIVGMFSRKLPRIIYLKRGSIVHIIELNKILRGEVTIDDPALRKITERIIPYAS